MKSYTSTRLKECIKNYEGESRKEWLIWMMERAGAKNGNNTGWQLWQQHNKPLEIIDEKMFFQKLNYIHRNAVEAGFVENEEGYVYSSAKDFYTKKGLVELCYWS